MRNSAIAVCFCFVLVVAACTGTPSSPTAQTTLDPTAEPTPSEVLDPATVAALELRERYGLRSDLEWIRAVADDPNALVPEDYGVPLMPHELADLMSRRWPNSLIVQLRDYGRQFPKDFATAYINQKASGAIVKFKANLEIHRANLAALPLDGPVVVERADWSLEELEGFLAQVTAEQAWIESTRAKWVQPVIYELENKVVIRYEGPRALEALIQDHFGSPGWLEARWEGPSP